MFTDDPTTNKLVVIYKQYFHETIQSYMLCYPL